MRRWIIPAGAALLAVLAALVWFGFIPLNHPSQPVRGVDVSHYQGDIDWPVLAGQAGIQFAYIKATEGSASVDERFAENWVSAREAGLRVGAYHFFSYDSPGASQAAHFIEVVPVEPETLPPVIDVEFYGRYDRSPALAEAVLPELRAMADALERHFGRAPVIYCTDKTYRLYIEGNFGDCGIWIRSVYAPPRAPRDWVFWQYSNRSRLKGYSGRESYIDMNVFYGDQAAFDAYAQTP